MIGTINEEYEKDIDECLQDIKLAGVDIKKREILKSFLSKQILKFSTTDKEFKFNK